MNLITRAKKMRVYDLCNILGLNEGIVVQTRSGEKLYAGTVSSIIDVANYAQPECAGYMVIDMDIQRHGIVLTVVPTTDDSYISVADAFDALDTRRAIRIVKRDLSPLYEVHDAAFPVADPLVWPYHNWPSLGICPFTQKVGIMVSPNDAIEGKDHNAT